MNSKAQKAKQMLYDIVPAIENNMDKHFDKQIQLAENEYTPFAVNYMRELRNIGMADAKRLRGSFVYYSYLMNGGKDIDSILDIASAIEIVHLYLLVEDDFMDISDTRRGYPTLHNTLSKLHKSEGYKNDPTHYGNSIAVTIGLLGGHMSLNMINNANFLPELRIRAMNQVNNQIIDTAHGQAHDILNSVKHEVSEEEVMNVLKWKTGIYTYDNPIKVGAIFAGASEETISLIPGYGLPAGVAFQIQDDILGSFGDEDKTGKSAESDIREGKQTLLTYYAYAKGSEKDKKILNKVLGDREAKSEDIDKVREIFVETGSLEYSKKKALELVHQAKESLLTNRKEEWVGEGFDFLEGIADYMIERDL